MTKTNDKEPREMNETQESAKPRRRSRWRMFLTRVVLPLAILALIGWIYDRTGRSAREDAMAEARAIGGPVTWDELREAHPRWPEAENGAAVVEPLREPLSKLRSRIKPLPLLGDPPDPPLGQRLSPEQMATLRAFLNEYASLLETLHQVRQYEHGSFPFEPIDPIEITKQRLERYGATRMAVRLEGLQALHGAMTGELDRALDHLDAAMRISRFMRHDKVVISALVCIACEAFTLSVAEDVLALAELNDDQLQRLATIFASAGDPRVMGEAFRGERAYFLEITGDLAAGHCIQPGCSLPSTLMQVVPGIHGFLHRDQATGLRRLNAAVDVADDPQALLDVARHNEEILDQGFAYLHPFTNILWPSLSRSVVLGCRTVAAARAARTAVAAELYRLAEGVFPQSLADLVPTYLDAVPVDPFTGSPLLTVRTDSEFVIYSVSDDGRDDGGQVEGRWQGEVGEEEEDQRRPAPDVGFVLLEPQYRGRAPGSAAGGTTVPTTASAAGSAARD